MRYHSYIHMYLFYLHLPTLKLLTQFNKSENLFLHKYTISFPPETPSMLEGSGVLQLFMVVISLQIASGLRSANFLASASLCNIFSLFLINHRAYLNLAFLFTCSSNMGPCLGLPAFIHMPLVSHANLPLPNNFAHVEVSRCP